METHVPNWLSPTTTEQSPLLVKYPRTGQELALRELVYENFFERALDRIALGHPLADIAEDDPRDIDPAQFVKWMRQDKTRKQRFHEAQEIAAEFLISAGLKAAAGNDSMNDVARDSLIVSANFKAAAMYAPKRFGKEAGVVSNGGGGPVVINIGTVESPYTINTEQSTPTIDISDVEMK